MDELFSIRSLRRVPFIARSMQMHRRKTPLITVLEPTYDILLSYDIGLESVAHPGLHFGGLRGSNLLHHYLEQSPAYALTMGVRYWGRGLNPLALSPVSATVWEHSMIPIAPSGSHVTSLFLL